MQAEVVQAAVAALDAAYDQLAACDIAMLGRDDLLTLIDHLEILGRRLPTQSQRMLARLQTETTPRALGAKTWNEVLRVRWRLSTAEAGRRLGDAADLQPRHSITGEPVDAALPAVAAAQQAGALTGEHIKVLRDTMRDIPPWVDVTTRAQIEIDLTRIAVGTGPKELRETAALRLFLLDQDGPEPDCEERARKRAVTTGTQRRDGMTPLTAHLDPEAAAVWEVLFAKFAAPGMCNPADDHPCTAGTPTQAQIDTDHRTRAQRQHDALTVIGRIALMTDLGHLNGLPVSIIIRTTLQDLQSRAGIGITGGGTLMPITDINRLGGHAAYHLCVFDGVTGSALNHFRSKRTATPAQRIMLIAKYGGCTKPGCTVGAYGCQIHHATTDYAHGGNTNVDDMAPACAPDNRMATHSGYTTDINTRGDCEWTPPPHLDTGQHRINYYHRPELLLTPPEDYFAPNPLTAPTPQPNSVPKPQSSIKDSPQPQPPNPKPFDTKPFGSETDDAAEHNTAEHDDEPGGPAPPQHPAA